MVVRQKQQLLLRFHPFGNDGQPQAVSQRDNGAGDGRVIGIEQHIADKGLVDLELVQRQSFFRYDNAYR